MDVQYKLEANHRDNLNIFKMAEDIVDPNLKWVFLKVDVTVSEALKSQGLSGKHCSYLFP